MENIIRKLTSRKLWLAIAGVASGIAIAFGVDAGDISTVAGAVTAIISIVTYIRTEGQIDAAAVKSTGESVKDAVETIEAVDDFKAGGTE